ncbi:hypothetical protein [Kosakonia cowanii]|uniref:hypothetical protein n=1 Tax=Kosakonia cowanii TaxID=208223 RepID=UPI00289AF5E1|nr:hypothetical protein [Kosakonia cowanii]
MPDKRYAPSGIIPTAPLPDGGFALSGLQKQSPLKRRRPDKRQRHPAFSPRHRLPDGGCALSGLQKRAFSDTVFAFICNMKARGCVPAEIGEPKRE